MFGKLIGILSKLFICKRYCDGCEYDVERGKGFHGGTCSYHIAYGCVKSEKTGEIENVKK